MTYTNELEVEIDFSDVDPKILKQIEKEKNIEKEPKPKDDSKSAKSRLKNLFKKKSDSKPE